MSKQQAPGSDTVKDIWLWNYLKRKLKRLNDNNYTARLIFDRVMR